MSTRSLIGSLEPDGLGYQARYCHNDGYPSHRLRQLADALHGVYAGDPAPLVAEILHRDWSVRSADAASTEVVTGEVRNPLRAPHVMPHAGIGYGYVDSCPTEILRGTLAEQPDRLFEWLYLVDATGVLRVFGNKHGQRWVAHHDLTVAELKDLDVVEVARGQRAVR
jgi:hypothetical protein